MSVFSEILGSLRREAGFSQRKVAQELGISQALLSHYENGAREPRLEFISRVCEYYGVTADYILGRTNRRTTEGCIEMGCFPEGAGACFDAVRDIFAMLSAAQDAELTSAAIKYLLISAETAKALIYTPGAPYDPLRDAELKTTEAQLVKSAQRIERANYPKRQENADD